MQLKDVGNFLFKTPKKIMNSIKDFTPFSEMTSFGSGTYEGNKMFNSQFSYLEAMEQLTWVSACVNAVAKAVRKQPWGIYSYKDDKPVTNGGKEYDKLAALLKNPTVKNSDIRGFKSFIERWVTVLLLTGKVPILKKEYDTRNFQPIKLQILRPDLFSPYFAKNNTGNHEKHEITNWIYKVEGQDKPIALDLAFQCILSHPWKRYEGLGTIQRNLILFNTEELLQRYNYMFFKNNAIQSKAVKIPEVVTEDAEKRLRQQLKSMEGVKNAHKFHLLMGGMDVVDLGVKHTDMAFPELKKMNREEILGLFQVPPAIVGIFEYANYANSKEQWGFFNNNTVQPMLDRIAETITMDIVSLFNPDWYFEFDTVETKDLKEYSEMAINLKNAGIFTPNEARVYMNEAKVEMPEMNDFYQPINMIPMGESGAVDIPLKKDGVKDQRVTKRIQMAILKIANLQKRRIGQKTKSDLKDFFKAQEKRILIELDLYKSVKEKDFDLKFIFHADKENAALRDSLKRSHVAITLKAGEELSELLGVETEINIDKPSIQKRIAKLGNQSTIINNTTMADIQGTLAEGMDAGESMLDLKKRVTKVYDKAKGYRAEMIAKTESFRAWDQGSLEQYGEMGVEYIDVIGCECHVYPCNASNVPIGEAEGLQFHPNHTGVLVPIV